MGLDSDILARDSERMNTSPAHKIAEGKRKKKKKRTTVSERKGAFKFKLAEAHCSDYH